MTPPAFVAVGASLGGLHASQKLLTPLPRNMPVPLAIVQHRLPTADSRLVALLAARTQLAVVEPEDKEVIRNGYVYLAPGDYHLLVDEGVFALSTEAPVAFARPSIDVFFESVADVYAERALALILTGSSEDGAVGAEAIKNYGGWVWVQDPKDAESPIAPKAVLERLKPDAVLTLDEMAAELCAWWNKG